MERASSVRPAPISPANPTTSPARTVNAASLLTRRPGMDGCSTFQPETSNSTSPTCGVRAG